MTRERLSTIEAEDIRKSRVFDALPQPAAAGARS
jgi:hypothetical protein